MEKKTPNNLKTHKTCHFANYLAQLFARFLAYRSRLPSTVDHEDFYCWIDQFLRNSYTRNSEISGKRDSRTMLKFRRARTTGAVRLRARNQAKRHSRQSCRRRIPSLFARPESARRHLDKSEENTRRVHRRRPLYSRPVEPERQGFGRPLCHERLDWLCAGEIDLTSPFLKRCKVVYRASLKDRSYAK